MTPCILGADPGLSGAIAFFFPDAPERVSVEDMPVVSDHVDVSFLKRRIEQMRPTLAIVERVGPMPKDRPQSAFRFGASYAALLAVVQLLDVPCRLVTPQVWKRHYSLLGKDKEASRALALRTFPASADRFSRKKDDGRAEASLIAKYGAEKQP